MSDGVMAAGTGDVLAATVYSAGIDGVSDCLMAPPAGSLGNAAVEFCNLYRVRILAGREVERVKEAVAGLDCIFAEQVVRGMTIVACSRRMMARFHPGFVLGAHGVTVGTCGRIVQQV